MKYIDPIESPDLHAYPIGSLVVRFVTKRNSASMISTVACNRTRSLNPARNLIDGAGTNTLVVDILIPTPPPYKLTRLNESLVNSHRAACMQINLNIWNHAFRRRGFHTSRAWFASKHYHAYRIDRSDMGSKLSLTIYEMAPPHVTR